MIRSATLVLAAALLAGCGASASTAGAPAASVSLTTSAPTVASLPVAAALPDTPTGPQLAAALDCTGTTAKPVTSAATGPIATSDGYCSKGGQSYDLTVYKSRGDATAAMTMGIAFLQPVLATPWQYLQAPTWIVGVNTSTAVLNPAPDMVAAAEAVGAVLKTVQPKK